MSKPVAETARCCGSPLSCGAHDPARYRPECVWPTPSAKHSEAWVDGCIAGKRGLVMSMIGVVKEEDWPDFKAGYAAGTNARLAMRSNPGGANGFLEGLETGS